MKTVRFVIFIAITLALGILLNTKIDSVPPLGKFLSPFHGFWMNAENQAIGLDSTIELSGLDKSVDIFFDKLLIPHIYADNMQDMYFSQGYVTAHHRLWQMEFQMLAAEGRVSEILGPMALEFDRSQRRIGLKQSAINTETYYKDTDPEIYSHVTAYAAGINAYIESLSYKDFPIEYKLLDYKPEPWTAFKSILFLSYMHDQLSRNNHDLEDTNALKLWGKDTFDILYPEIPDFTDPVIPVGTTFNFEPILIEKPDIQFPLKFSNPTIAQPDPDNGSNNFAVNGNKTANGKVIMTNEPDLSLTAPSIWYVAHLNAPGVNVMGSTFPGTPNVILGFNDSISWGATNAKRDLVDWYYVEFEDETREAYKYNNQWVPTLKIVEEFKIRGEDNFYDTILFTHHGPVTYDKYFPASKTDHINLAMKWVAHTPSMEHKALYLAAKANNVHEFNEAFQHWNGPAQNFISADVSGNIALTVHGNFPVKWEGQGKFLMDGNDIRQEWKTFMPKNHNLSTLNPERDFVSSANQHAADSTYPYYQYDHGYEHFRGRRINDRLNVMTNITVEDMMALQHDNFNYNASEALPMMLDSLDTASFTAKERSYFDQLSEWDFFSEPDLEAPTLYETWWKKLNSKLWEEIDSASVKVYRPDYYNTYYILKNKPDFFMVDNAYTSVKETTGDLYRITFKETIEELEAYRQEGKSLEWYQFKNTTVKHLLRLAPFSTDQIKIGGNRGIVNAASSSHGPSWRMVVELGDGKVNAWGVYPGSQSGNPGNPTYGGMIDNWASGKYHKMLFEPSPENFNEDVLFKLTLKPEK